MTSKVSIFDGSDLKKQNIDLSLEFGESEEILIDGDALIIDALKNPGLSWHFGGEFLHLVYLVERKLNIFVKKGAKFKIIFFQDANIILWKDDTSKQLVRKSLILHLQHNTGYDILLCFDNPLNHAFKQYLIEHIPTLIIMTLDSDVLLNDRIKRESTVHCYVRIQVYQLLFLHINVGLLENLQLGISTLNGFYISYSSLSEKSLAKEMSLKEEYKRILHKKSLPKKMLSSATQLLSMKIEEHAAILYLLNKDEELPKAGTTTKSSIDKVKLFLLYSVMKNLTPLCNRSFVLLRNCKTLHGVCKELQICLLDALQKGHKNYEKVADLWDGNLFANVANILLVCASQNINPFNSSPVMLAYRSSLKIVFDYLNISDEEENLFRFDVAELFEKVDDGYVKGLNESVCSINIVPMETKLVSFYVGEIYKSMNVLDDNDPKLRNMVSDNKHFYDIYHWHNSKQINSLYDLLRINFKLPDVITFDNKRKQQRYLNKIPRLRQVYSSSLGGHKNKIMIVSINSKCGKVKKVSGKAHKIIEDNMKRLELAASIKQQNQLDLNLNLAKTMEKSGDNTKALEILEDIDFEFAVDKIGFVQKKFQLMRKCFNECESAFEKNELIIKCLLTIRNIQAYEKLKLYTKEVKTMLHHLKFYRLSILLLGSSNDDEDSNHDDNISHQIFQLLNMGHLMLRDVCTEPDKRISSFIPDEWQRKLFDYIDKDQSVLIVAPTSSGKTFASYYCMERVLRRSNSDVIVYVSPTKALCNQVMAMVDSLFEKPSLPAGKSICGIFTADFRTNLETCQILVTVPQCLEILLLSADGFEWSNRIKYVIFDEMHCLGAETGAEVWEHLFLLISCPFLALSATIQNPSDLHSWLQCSQEFIKQKDDLLFQKRPDESYKVNLVIVNGRYADLEKFNYLPDTMTQKSCKAGLTPIHPICSLHYQTIIKNKGIPEHVSLTSKESYDLYEAMHDVWEENENLKDLNPLEYFYNETFLKKITVTEYSNILKKELENWVFNESKKFFKVQLILNADTFEKSCTTKDSFSKHLVNYASYEFVMSSFVSLMNTLKEENQLPCIVFCMDRMICECLVEIIVDYCIKKETEYCRLNDLAKKTKENSFLKREAKKQKDKEVANESLSHYKPNEQNEWFDFECHSGVTFQGKGISREDVTYFYERVKNDSSSVFMNGIRYGICYHHAGLNNRKRMAVETLFRKKFINIVVATATLSQGIHVPCKTVVIAGDSVYLTPLSYRQMSGRAGRRGFDLSGKVIFSGIPETKMNRLISGNLQTLKGNFPINVSLCLRLLIMVQGTRNENDCVARALNLLENPLILQQNSSLKTQFKLHFLFSVQYLVREGYLNKNCQPQGLAGIISHLHFYEPGNFAFVSCLKEGLFHTICEDFHILKPGNNEYILRELIAIISYFFTDRLVHPSDEKRRQELRRYVNHVYLPPLPNDFCEHIEDYNYQVNKIFDEYLKSVATYCEREYGEDNILPLSKVKFCSSKDFTISTQDNCIENLLHKRSQINQVCSSFVALSGHCDENLIDSELLLNNCRQEIYTDVKVIPTFDHDRVLNSYALDFFKNGNIKALTDDNGIRENEVFTLLKNFMLVLQAISTSLKLYVEDDEDDDVVNAFSLLAEEFKSKFKKAFNYNA